MISEREPDEDILAAVKKGLEDIDAGRTVDAEELFEWLARRYEHEESELSPLNPPQ
jgi:predicted transcriptional regulator